MADIFQKIINFIFRIDLVRARVNGEGGGGTPSAPTGGNLPTFDIRNPLELDGNIDNILNAVTDLLLTVGFPIAMLMYLWAGFQFLTSGGEEKKIKSAKQTLLWTTVGIVVLLTARAIVAVITGLLTP